MQCYTILLGLNRHQGRLAGDKSPSPTLEFSLYEIYREADLAERIPRVSCMTRNALHLHHLIHTVHKGGKSTCSVCSICSVTRVGRAPAQSVLFVLLPEWLTGCLGLAEAAGAGLQARSTLLLLSSA
jgi:hypothetical protein